MFCIFYSKSVFLVNVVCILKTMGWHLCSQGQSDSSFLGLCQPGGIMAAAFWRSPEVFHCSYLRDLAESANGIYSMSSIAVAQQVV